MIKYLSSAGPYLQVAQSTSGQIGMYPSMPSTGAVGMMRWNPTSNGIEVWDGSAWVNVTSTAEVSLSREAEELLDWAKKQKARSEKLERLAEDNVTLQDALDRYKNAEEALRIVEALCDTGNSGASHT